MEIGALQQKATAFVKKYKYAALVLLIGVVLMAIPTGGSDTDTVESPQPEVTLEIPINQQLASVLSQIDGAGRVEVFLTVAAGEETVYQTNDDVSVNADTSATQKDTVTITDAQRNQSGLIRQVNPPRYLGAIVVCQGADRPTVCLAIVDAVSKVTGLGSDRISVLKMK